MNIYAPQFFYLKKKKKKQNSVRDHEVSHLPVKSHVCDICDKKFKLKNNLLKHSKIHQKS